MFKDFRLPVAVAVGLSVTCLLAAGATGAVAQQLITGKEIANGTVTGEDLKDKTVTGADVRDGSLTKTDFSGSLTGPQGPMGPQGTSGATGPRGPAGPAGDGADEYRTWTFHHKATDPLTTNGWYAAIESQGTVSGPAALTVVEVVIPDAIKAWTRANCERGYISITVGGMGAVWDWSSGMPYGEPAEEHEDGFSGGLIRHQSRPASGYVECRNSPTWESVTPIPDFDATVTFGIDYIEPGTITSMN